MKTAIVSDSFIHIGGAEKVLLELLSLYPTADLFVPIINKNIKEKVRAKTKGKIYTTFFSYFPFFYKNASLLKPVLIFYWERLNLSKYSLVISASHSFNSKLINTSKKSVHISYVYTPPRYLSNNFNEIQIIKYTWIQKIVSPLIGWLHKKDLESGQKPNLIISISKTIQQRVLERYKRKSLLIYPPVSISKIIKNNKNKYYLCFSRLVKQKGIDLAVRTCTKYDIPLVVVGTGPEEMNLKKIAGPTITFLGFVDDSKIEKVFSDAKALINCAIEEDFGMVTIEAASMGLPVIGYKSGGILETIVEGKTGLFFENHTVESLITCIRKFEKMKFKSQETHNFAQQFSSEIFKKKFSKLVSYYSKEFLNYK